MPDMLSMHFRYANKLAQSSSGTPERGAFSDIVYWISRGRSDHDNLAIARAQITDLLALMAPRDDDDAEVRERSTRMRAVYQEFLNYTSSL